jgi:hypothetical protein
MIRGFKGCVSSQRNSTGTKAELKTDSEDADDGVIVAWRNRPEDALGYKNLKELRSVSLILEKSNVRPYQEHAICDAALDKQRKHAFNCDSAGMRIHL